MCFLGVISAILIYRKNNFTATSIQIERNDLYTNKILSTFQTFLMS